MIHEGWVRPLALLGTIWLAMLVVPLISREPPRFSSDYIFLVSRTIEEAPERSWQDYFHLLVHGGSLFICFSAATGIISYFFRDTFPSGSLFEFLQGCDCLPFLVPIVDLSENIFSVCAKVRSASEALHWNFLASWFNQVYSIVFWSSTLLLVYSVLHFGLSVLALPPPSSKKTVRAVPDVSPTPRPPAPVTWERRRATEGSQINHRLAMGSAKNNA